MKKKKPNILRTSARLVVIDFAQIVYMKLFRIVEKSDMYF